MWVLSRYDDIWSILKDPQSFSSADTVQYSSELTDEARAILSKEYEMASHLLNSDPPLHTRLRRFIGKAFSTRRINGHAPKVRQLASELIDRFPEGHADLIADYAFPLTARAILSMIGLPLEDADKIKHWCDNWFALVFSNVPKDQQVGYAESVVAYQNYCRDLIEKRRQSPQEDLTSDLVQASEEGETPLTMSEMIHAIGGSLIAGGHETTTSLIGAAVKLALSTPGWWQRLRETPALIPRFIDETLRFDSTTTAMVRTATKDVEVAGKSFPKGTKFYLLYGSANRDVSRFKEADTFDPMRESEELHLAFGRGIHFCIGAPLARLEAQIALELLTQRLPDARLVEGQNFEYVPSFVLRSFKHLQVTWPAGR
jgi:cytochrome P450